MVAVDVWSRLGSEVLYMVALCTFNWLLLLRLAVQKERVKGIDIALFSNVEQKYCANRLNGSQPASIRGFF